MPDHQLLVSASVLAIRGATRATLFTCIGGKNRYESLTRAQLLYLIESGVAALRAMENTTLRAMENPDDAG